MPENDADRLSEGALFVDEDEVGGALDDEDRGAAGDGKAEEALDVLDGILARMDLDTEVSIREDGERIVLDVDGPDAGRAIGRKGQTLDALQFLVNKIVNRFPTGRRHVIIDSGDYRERHDENLVNLAERQAKRALKQGRVVTLHPMSARDRRVVHMCLADYEGVSTRSDGKGVGRRIRIIPDD